MRPKTISAVLGVLIVCLQSAPALGGEAASAPRREVLAELTDFSLCELDPKTHAARSDCIPARVPGDVFTALLEAGRIEDPYRDLNSRDVQWVDERDWRYETSFEYRPAPGKRLHLLFMGVDYISAIELGGKKLAEHEGMFSRIDLDVTDILDPGGTQRLAVVLTGVRTTDWSWLGPILSSNEFGRRKFLKTQMSFDWDFSPRLKGAGIWDRVYLYESGAETIKDIFAKPSLDGGLELEVDLRGSYTGPARVTVEVVEDWSGRVAARTTTEVALENGWGRAELSTRVPNPKLWWPWDMGEPSLYQARATLTIDGEVSDQASETFGFREISWGPNPNAPADTADWVLFINGRREFMRGANWVPPEAMAGRLTVGRYERLIEMARSAGVNMLRIWGGGNREWRAFYDECDRRGVMVWQEFPFACVYLAGYPRDRRFTNLVRQESDEMVRQLRDHPSLIMWCGGNEFNATQNRHVVDILAERTAALDPTRRFIQASPYKGDAHNWIVWHQKGNLTDYFMDVSQVPSEFGLQAFPAVATLEKWFSPEYLWPINEVYIHHDLGRAKMEKYVSCLQPDDDLESWVEASQTMQAHFLQRGIENWRRRKYETSGTAFWQLNEPWPAISWAVIDYELTPKKAYFALQHAYAPVLVSADYPDRRFGPGDDFTARLTVVNDLHQDFPGARITAELCGQKPVEFPADVPADEVIEVGEFAASIPDDVDRPFLTLRLSAGGETISENRYELWVHDPTPAGKLNYQLWRIGFRIMSGQTPPKWDYPD